MSAANHPCDRYSCPEWNQGQCFGGGCRANPIRRDDADEDCDDDAAERELNDEWIGEGER